MSDYKLKERPNAEVICRLLGIEINKSFNIVGDSHNPYTIKEDGLCDRNGFLQPNTFFDLMFGNLEIEDEVKFKEITFKEAIKIMTVDENFVYFRLNTFTSDRKIELRKRLDTEGFMDEDFNLWWLKELLDAKFYIKEDDDED